MDASYQLDDDDHNDIQKKLLEVFGNYSWKNLDNEERENVIKYVSEKYLAFIQKRIYAKKNITFFFRSE